MTPERALVERAREVVEQWYRTDYSQQSGLVGAVDHIEEAELVSLVAAFAAEYAREQVESLAESRAVLADRLTALRAENDRLTLAASESARTLQVEIASLRERLQWIRALASGYDADGALGPRAPLSWESVARMAMDYADVSRLPQDGA